MSNERNNPFADITDVGQAEDLINQFRRDYPDDIEGARSVLKDLLEELIAPDIQICGDANDFHNFAITISRLANDNKSAYAIVRKGLKIHETNTDLLADALKYGYNCGEKEECKNWYQVLHSIEKTRWSWRAFSFTIEYLMDLYSSTEKNDFSIDDILKLVKEYQERLPDEEDAWVSEQYIYENTNQRQKGIMVLENAIEKFRFCPKCWLRYADIMIEKGDYEKAEPIIRKMRRNPKTCESINTSYMFFLDGLCKMTKLLNTDEYEAGEVDEHEVLIIYRAFQLALKSSGLRENTKRRIDEYIARLVLETGIEFD